MKRLIVLLVTIATLSLIPTSPAQAYHANAYGHWNNPPVVATPQNGFEDKIQDAAYYWQDHGFYRGYYPPLPSKEMSGGVCDFRWWVINICVVPQGDSRLNGRHGWTHNLWDGNGHIYSSMVYISNGLDNASTQILFRHEFGHALGLGHNNHCCQSSVMNDPAGTPFGTSSDFYAIQAWQPHSHPDH